VLEKLLQHERESISVAAATVLGRQLRLQAASSLEMAAKDRSRSWPIRLSAFEAFCMLDVEATKTAAQQILHDIADEPEYEERAISAYSMTTPCITHALTEGDSETKLEVLKEIAVSTHEYYGLRAVEPVARLLCDNEPMVREEAADTIRAIVDARDEIAHRRWESRHGESYGGELPEDEVAYFRDLQKSWFGTYEIAEVLDRAMKDKNPDVRGRRPPVALRLTLRFAPRLRIRMHACTIIKMWRFKDAHDVGPGR
jgi:hypothetical protein